MAAHKDIRILFEIDGHKSEAVGFLAELESSINGDEMLARTATENGGAIGDEDEAFLREHFGQLPESLRRYYLATNRRHPDYPRYVSYFSWYGDRWYQYGHWLDNQVNDYGLVVRRCA